MPRFDNDNLQHNQVGHFGFSATRIEDLGATEYTLVTIVVDASGSVGGFVTELEKAIQEVVQSCQLSPRADNLMIRLIRFNGAVDELHGFKLLSSCNVQDYQNFIGPSGSTALYDATVDGIESLSNYGQQLLGQDFLVNGLLVVITDGEENQSTLPISRVRDALQAATTQEKLESVTSILIGVNDQCATSLQKFKNDAGFTEFLNLKDASKQSLAKLAKFVSRSISATSQSVGSGAAPASLTF
jgi:uncharacterized protein YegL